MLNNQDFARLRSKSLGGSDIGAILGLSPYRTAVDVWLEKTGQAQSSKDSLPLRFGQFAEEFVASEYALATSSSLLSHPDALVHPKYSYMHGHIDRFVCEAPSIFDASGKLLASKILECKTANAFTSHAWGEGGSDQVPMAYLAQCLWYMAITGIEQADLAVLLGNADFRIYEVHRDIELEEIMIERARIFWEEHVLKRVPPRAQRESDLKLLFPRSQASKSIEAPKELIELIIQLKAIQSQVASHEEKMSEIKQALMGHMQDAEVLTYQGQVLATWKAPKASTRIDTKRLALEHPEMIAAYQTEVANSRRLVIKDL